MAETETPAPDCEAAGLESALLAAQTALLSVEKTGRNQSQGWEFLEAGAIFHAARKALNGNGLSFRLEELGDDPALIRGELVLVHPASGESARFRTSWPVTRPGDQGRRSAFTYCLKQGLLNLLVISEGPDPETHAEPESKSKPTRIVEAMATAPQLKLIYARLGEMEEVYPTPEAKRQAIADLIGRPLESTKELTYQEAGQVINWLKSGDDA